VREQIFGVRARPARGRAHSGCRIPLDRRIVGSARFLAPAGVLVGEFSGPLKDLGRVKQHQRETVSILTRPALDVFPRAEGWLSGLPIHFLTHSGTWELKRLMTRRLRSCHARAVAYEVHNPTPPIGKI
jgi:hypothetical protein